MTTIIHDAHYRDETLDEFRYNPLIEAMPAPFEPGDAIAKLMIRPPYSDSDRECTSSHRQLLTQRIVRIHQPMEREVDVFSRIDRCIRWGYADRNPLTRAYSASLRPGCPLPYPMEASTMPVATIPTHMVFPSSAFPGSEKAQLLKASFPSIRRSYGIHGTGGSPW